MTRSYSYKAFIQWGLHGKKHFTQTGYQAAAKKYDKPDSVMTDANLKGKNYLITGANSGIGFQLTMFLASKAGTVYMVCRNKERGEKALEKVRAEHKDADVHLLLGDMGLKTDVERVAKNFEEQSGGALDCLVVNAGALLNEKTVTKEGLEVTFACHLLHGCYYLKKLLLPFLKKCSDPRVVLVTSGGMYPFKFPAFEYVTAEKGIYSGLRAYGQAKRGQVLLAERWAEEHKDVKFVSAHPGWAMTEGIASGLEDNAKFFEPYRTPWEGTEGIAWLCVCPGASIETGALYLDRFPQVKHMAGPFFTEGTFTKNSKEEVDEMVNKLEAYLVNPVTQFVRPVVSTGLTLLTEEKKKAPECQTCKESFSFFKKQYFCGVCGEAQCSDCSSQQVQGSAACGRCFKQNFAVGEQKEAIHDDFMNDIFTFCLDNNWSALKPTKDCQLFSRSMPGTSVKAFKVVKNLKSSIAALNKLLHDEYIEKHKLWNPSFKAGRYVKKIDDDNNLQYWQFGGAAGSDRDFVVARRRDMREDGSLLLVERSVALKEVPVVSKCIRADMPFHLRLFTQKSEGVVEYLDVNMTDIGGWVPTGLANSANTGITIGEMEKIEECALAIDKELQAAAGSPESE